MDKNLKKVLEEHNVNIDNIILLGYVGSQSHGTYISQGEFATDDKDVLGVIIQEPKRYLGFNTSRREQITIMQDEWDIVLYDMEKYTRLLCKQNPNILSLLWLPTTCYIQIKQEGHELINMRQKFLTKNIYKTFCGYAQGQLSKATRNACLGYMGKKRKELVRQFGFDCKNMSHNLRLLRMGIEALIEQKINVLRPESSLLIDIKTGKYTLEELQKMSADLLSKINMAYINTKLPDDLDREEIEKWLIKTLINKLCK